MLLLRLSGLPFVASVVGKIKEKKPAGVEPLMWGAIERIRQSQMARLMS
jgi:hypothetical protein